MAMNSAKMKVVTEGRVWESRKTSQMGKEMQAKKEYAEVYDFEECLPGLGPLK